MFAHFVATARCGPVPFTPAPGNLTHIDTYTGTNTATLGTHQSGDLLIAWAIRDGSSTAPTIPAQWTTIASGGANSLGYALVWMLADSAAETVGTFTNATSVLVVHERPATGWTPSIGAVAANISSAGVNPSVPELTLQNTDNTSRVFAFYGSRAADVAGLSTPPSGMELCDSVQDATDTAAAYRTTSSVSSWSAATTAFTGTSTTVRMTALELKMETSAFVAAPTSPSAAVSGTQITVSWTDTNSGAAQHSVERSADGSTGWAEVALVAAGTNSYVNTGLANGTYYYRIRAYVAPTYSSYTTTVSDTVSSGGSAPTYTPLKMAWFDAGTTGAQAGGTSGFDVPQDTSVNGYPTFSTAIEGPYGGGKVARMAWSAADRYFFGGDIFNGTQNVIDGDEMWVRQWLYVVPTFSWGDNGGGDSWGNTKWLRQWFTDGGDNCFQMNSTGKCFGMTTEGYTGAGSNLTLSMGAMPAIPQGQWVCQEFYILFHSNASNGKIRYWQDGTYYGEQTGCTKAPGTSTVNRILHGDYWNGGSPQAQTWYLDEVIITFDTPDDADAGARPFIGTTRQVGDF